MTPILEVENLSFAYDARCPVLREISFRVFQGDCVGILGANGAGKTTLIWCLLGLLKASGSLRLFGKRFSRSGLARVGVVFQNPEDQLFMPTILEDITLPLINQRVPLVAARSRAAAALESVGLPDAATRPASQLSLGERKRAAIALALAREPELLILDEPTAELDGRSVRQLATLLQRVSTARLFTTHHIEFLRQVASRTLILLKGKIVVEGPSDQVLASHSLLEQAGLI